MTHPEHEPAHSPDDLFEALYRELHDLARLHLRGRTGLTLGTTTLLHEAYLNIAQRTDTRFADPRRFLSYASRAMRGLIIDYARRRAAAKRGGEFVLLSLDPDELAPATAEGEELRALGDALDDLARADRDLAELVDLHFFCGLSFADIAGLRGVSERTVQRDWRKARLILHETLRPDP